MMSFMQDMKIAMTQSMQVTTPIKRLEGAVQFRLHGGQFDFARSSARTS